MIHCLLLLLAALPLQLWPSVEPQMTVLESEQREGYICSLVEYNAVGPERVQAFLLVPDGASADNPRPGLVLLHDHGARFDIGKEKLVRPLESAPPHIRASALQWVQDGFDGVFLADRLAAEGYVVIVPDALYWGSRSTGLCQEWSRMQFGAPLPEGRSGDIRSVKQAVYEGQRAVYDSLASDGIVWAEQTLNEDAAAARLLAALPCVDSGRVGCFGWSMGAHRAWLLGAFCDAVKTGVALCWMTLKSTQTQPPTASDYSMMIPELRSRYDFPDIARWLRPKPFLFLNGRTDRLFPADATQEAFDRMQSIYAEAGDEGALLTEFFDGGHHCGLREQERILQFFGQRFGLVVPGTLPEVAPGILHPEDSCTLGLQACPGAETVVVYKHSGYVNNAVITRFKGYYYCMWQQSVRDEDSPDTRIRYARSADGKSWSSPRLLVAPTDSTFASPGGWIRRGDSLVALVNMIDAADRSRGGTAWYVSTKDGRRWSRLKPVLMADGSQVDGIFEQDPLPLAGGRIVGAVHFRPGYRVAPVYTDDPSGVRGWRRSIFPEGEGTPLEPSQYKCPDGTLVMLFRDQESSFVKLASLSSDRGESWGAPGRTGIPDSRSKQCAGTLPDGRSFIVGNPTGSRSRRVLAIAFSGDGRVFDEVRLLSGIRDLPQRRHEGRYKTPGYNYPKAFVSEDAIWIALSRNKEDVVVIRVPAGTSGGD
ncbi:MAG: exo-alpha-sialidase [Bacteroidales bacterium]|nr:exo-alpha-sialidase [Bacteroidales bacterium]